MADDCRISTALPTHHKTRKLRKRLGTAGCWSLVCLFLFTANNRADGNLNGMSDEDVELAADWDGESGSFVRTLCEVGFLEGAAGDYRVHDWAQHNPWAASRGVRIDAARRAAAARWDKIRGACEEHAEDMRDAEERNAHHPTPPTPNPTTQNRGGVSGSDEMIAGIAQLHPKCSHLQECEIPPLVLDTIIQAIESERTMRCVDREEAVRIVRHGTERLIRDARAMGKVQFIKGEREFWAQRMYRKTASELFGHPGGVLTDDETEGLRTAIAEGNIEWKVVAKG